MSGCGTLLGSGALGDRGVRLALRGPRARASRRRDGLMLSIHPNARTTPAVRAEIARSAEPTGELARRYGVSTETVRKWRKRGPAQHLADRALVQPDREAGLDQGLQVDPPPAHHAVPVGVRPSLHGGRQLGLLLG